MPKSQQPTTFLQLDQASILRFSKGGGGCARDFSSWRFQTSPSGSAASDISLSEDSGVPSVSEPDAVAVGASNTIVSESGKPFSGGILRCFEGLDSWCERESSCASDARFLLLRGESASSLEPLNLPGSIHYDKTLNIRLLCGGGELFCCVCGFSCFYWILLFLL